MNMASDVPIPQQTVTLTEHMQVLDQYNQGIEARNRMLELILPGKVVFLRPRKVSSRCAAVNHEYLHEQAR